MSLRLISKLVDATSTSSPVCLQCVSQRACPIRTQIYSHVTRRFQSEAKEVPVKRKLTKTRKFLYGLGILAAVSGGAYQFLLKEPQRRKVRVTVGGFGRFLR